MILTFVWPSSNIPTGGVTMLYEFANALARRGHDVQFVHGPWNKYRISALDELDHFAFHRSISHYLVDTLDDPRLPAGDIVFQVNLPAHMGLPCSIVQGYGMFASRLDKEPLRSHAPKVCVARWLTEIGQDLGVPAEQLWHIPLGIDHDLFNVGDSPIERSLDIAVLCHLHPKKGWDVASSVLQDLQSRRPNLRTVVFGPDQPREELPPGTRLLHRTTQRQLVEDVYRKTRVFLQTSRNEGFGLTPVEAMSCGAALVTTDNGGSQDYAFHGETALVTESEDVTGLADAVETLLDDDDQRKRLATVGREHCLGFDWDRNAALLEEYFERYIADPARYQQAPAELTDLEKP